MPHSTAVGTLVIDGSSIEIRGFSWGLTQTGTTHAGTGGGAGKANVHDVTVIKAIDRSSPMLVQKCASGSRIASATISLTRAGSGQSVTIKVDDLIISSIQLGDDGVAGGGPSEVVAMNFSKVTYTVTAPSEPPVTATWNVATNAP